MLSKIMELILRSVALGNSGERRCSECSGVNGDHKDDCSFNPANW